MYTQPLLNDLQSATKALMAFSLAAKREGIATDAEFIIGDALNYIRAWSNGEHDLSAYFYLYWSVYDARTIICDALLERQSIGDEYEQWMQELEDAYHRVLTNGRLAEFQEWLIIEHGWNVDDWNAFALVCYPYDVTKLVNT